MAGAYGDQQKHWQQGTIPSSGGSYKDAVGGRCPRGGGDSGVQPPRRCGRRAIGVLREQCDSWLFPGEARHDLGHPGRLHHAQC